MDMLIGGRAAATPNDLIKDATDESFEQDVLVASQTTPVIVDFHGAAPASNWRQCSKSSSLRPGTS